MSASLNPAVATLTRILELEEYKGFQDAAVAGGLHRFSETWSRQARAVFANSGPPDASNLIDEISIALHNYQSFGVEARKSKVARARALLARLGGGATPHPDPVAPQPGRDKSRPYNGDLSMAQSTAPQPGRDKSRPYDDNDGPVGAQFIAPSAALREPSAAELLTGERVGDRVDGPMHKPRYAIPTMPSVEERVGTASELPVMPRELAQKRSPVKPKDVDPAVLDEPITLLRGVSEKFAALFAKLGVMTIRDLLYFFPRRHDDFSQLHKIAELTYGATETVIGTVAETWQQNTRKGFGLFRVTIEDNTGMVQATWFNQRWLANQITRGQKIVISGKVDEYQGRLTFQSPQWEPYTSELTHTGRLVPVYPLTEGLTAQSARRIAKQALDNYGALLHDFLPPAVRERAGLMLLPTAVQQAHFPTDFPTLERARRRLAFDEFLLIQLGMLMRKREWQVDQPGRAIEPDSALLERFIATLPFELTGAQQKTLADILGDMEKPLPMSRLLQGDVGSGKTVVAAIAMLAAAAAGYQSVLMAPTEILAEQHYRTLSQLLAQISLPAPEGTLTLEKKLVDGKMQLGGLLQGGERPLQVRLLTGSVKKAEKRRIYQEAAQGSADIFIGTHALIQEKLEFNALGLVVVDEQHRFGVLQRNALRQKGYNPDTLVMTATPIPRSLALTVYGDLDVSVIDEKPVGRLPIKTKWLAPNQRDSAYRFIRKMVGQGQQAFIICPLVEESDKVEAKAAVDEHARLQAEVFPDLKLGLVHGRLKAEEKDKVMAAFRAGEFNILVSTSVVEVGIDVPNATVMMVEGANRFGLSQLHQFRGRVGRGEAQSYCMLLADSVGVIAEERLKVIESTENGFVLAEADLNIRGPGQFFGTRQSGYTDLRMANLSDMTTIELARREAQAIFAEDPSLSSEPNAMLRAELQNFWAGRDAPAEART
ncbi:MAG: DNA helicase RecG [Candidatus Chloroheliales bacterium]|nr:MAG: DNA helicase RecG [Chloroflexota bacterium]